MPPPPPFYAQRGEDKRLCELLNHCKLDKELYYVDVGAWSPTFDSVTKHFYDSGSHGINVEPVPVYFEQLQRERQRDTNLMAAVSVENGFGDFHHFKDTGLSTFRQDYKYPDRQEETLRVVTMRLDKLLRTYTLPGQKIDFLKIDVEGWEREVVASNDWRKYRPRILCIESTIPGTEIPAPEMPVWETEIIRAGYTFFEFDGLNRFYQDGSSI